MPSIEPHPDLIPIGRLVRQRMREAGVTQSDLAGAIGMSRASVANITAGRQNIPTTMLLHIASLLDINTGELTGAPAAATPPRGDNDALVRRACSLALKALAELESTMTEQARILREAAAVLDEHADF